MSYQRALAVVWDNVPAGLSGADGEQERGGLNAFLIAIIATDWMLERS